MHSINQTDLKGLMVCAAQCGLLAVGFRFNQSKAPNRSLMDRPEVIVVVVAGVAKMTLSVSSGTEHKSTYVARCLLSGAKRYNRTFCLELHYWHGAVSRLSQASSLARGCRTFCLELHYWHGAKLKFFLPLGRHRQTTFSLFIGLQFMQLLTNSQ